MKQLRRLLTFTGLFVAALFLVINMESCSSHKGIVSCPDIHHRNLAMHHVHYHNGNALAHNHHKDVTPQQATNTAPKTDASPTQPNAQQKPDDGVTGGGIAAASSGLPKLKNPKEMFKLLTEEEREQVKSEVSSLLGKHTMLKKMFLKKMERMDKKYPAPAKSSLQGGNALGTGDILAIVAIALCLFFFLGLVALVLGIVALMLIKKNGGQSWAKILAIVAIILGALELLILLLIIIFVVAIAGGAFLFF